MGAFVIHFDVLAKGKTDNSGSVVYNFETNTSTSTSTEEENQNDLLEIEQLLKNPTVVYSLESGAKAIDQSVETLMESIFYRLMDQEFPIELTEHSLFSIGLKRDVFSSRRGTYVVVDRVSLGPRFAKEISRLHNIPVNLGVNGNVEVMDMYLRSDGIRLAEQSDLPLWRRLVNNWFGLLPILSSILPPSFNPNEMYDPLRMLKVPFVFPTSMKSFDAMPQNSIRSYSISGGISIGIDFASLLDKKSLDLLAKTENFTASLPYAMFKEGNYRINVLKKSPTEAWVGSRRLDRTGHSIGADLGRTLYVLAGVFPYFNWKGIPVGIFPIDFELSQSLLDEFDLLYTYDLQNPLAISGYLEAVKGNFVLSHQLAEEEAKSNGKKKTGVQFQFTKQRDAVEAGLKNNQKFFVWRESRLESRSKGEVEVVDDSGKYYVLEAIQELNDENWNVLVDRETVSVRNQFEIRVDRGPAPENDPSGQSYLYTYSNVENPMNFTATFDIRDRYTDTMEFEDYIKMLKTFSGLKLTSIPKFPIRDSQVLDDSNKERFFVNPAEDQLSLHAMPTVLGKFEAQASINFSTQIIDVIANMDDNTKWRAFARAFRIPAQYWKSEDSRKSAIFQLQWLRAFVAYPLRFFNLRVPSFDAIKEAFDGIKALEAIKQAKAPLEKLDGFYKLFDTDHPMYLAKALLILAKSKNVPRKVTFFTDPHNRLSDEIKRDYGGLNNRTFSSKQVFPPVDRYRVIRQKLAAFYPSEMKEGGLKPMIESVSVDSREVPQLDADKSSADQQKQDDLGNLFGMISNKKKHVFLSLKVANLPLKKAAKIYLKFETSGATKLGKLVLAEEVINLSPVSDSAETPQSLEKATKEKKEDIDSTKEVKMPSQYYEFFLTGPLSPLKNFVFDKAINFGGEFTVTVMVSKTGQIWSDDRIFRFQIIDGNPAPPSS